VAVTFRELLRSPQTSESSGVTVTANAGGSFPATTSTGFQFYLHYVDTANNVGFGPYAAIATRKTCTLNQQFDIAVLPNLSGVNANWFKLISRTGDGTGFAKFCASSSKTISSLSFSYGSGSPIMTATATAHGFSVGDVIEIAVSGFEGVYTIATTPTADTFTYADFSHRIGQSTAGLTGTAYKLVTVNNATTTVSITSTLTGELQANVLVGVAASAFSASDAGYQLYMSLYNATTGQIGNRIAVQGRLVPGTAGTRAIFYSDSITQSTTIDSEFTWLMGRTGDNSSVPYVITDIAGNFKHADVTQFVLRDPNIDTSKEMPTRNTRPSGLTQIVKAADRLYGIKGDAYVYYTPASNPDYNGKVEQSWPANNYEGFPTGEIPVAITEYAQQCMAFSDNFCAILVDNAGSIQFDGPWNVGIAGKRAFTKTPYGPYWLSADKKLYTFEASGPVCVSEEYEKALLGQIGSSYISAVEVAYENDPDRDLDRIIVKFKDANGNPIIVYHDFRLRDSRSPYGQGYDAAYSGQLASDFTIAQIRDSAGKLRIWAGGANGKFYQLDTTGTDDASTFAAEYIALVNEGEATEAIEAFLFYGDKKIAIANGRDLNSLSTSSFDSLVNQQVGEMRKDFQFRVARKKTEVNSPEYWRFTLTSHAADAGSGDYPSGTTSEPMTLSTIPHLPVEVYGRLCAAGVEG
jgi:hypothetical protein